MTDEFWGKVAWIALEALCLLVAVVGFWAWPVLLVVGIDWWWWGLVACYAGLLAFGAIVVVYRLLWPEPQ